MRWGVRILTLERALGTGGRERLDAAVRHRREVPLALEGGVIALAAQQVPDGRNVAGQLADPGEVGVVPGAGVLGVHVSPSSRARACTLARCSIAGRAHALRLKAPHGRRLHRVRHLHVGLPLVHAEDQNVKPPFALSRRGGNWSTCLGRGRGQALSLCSCHGCGGRHPQEHSASSMLCS